MARKANAKGRSKTPDAPYWIVPYSLLKHPAWRGLSGSALKVLCELHSRFQMYGDGNSNNGMISLSLDEGARLLGMGKATVDRALKELVEIGFIAMTRRGHWYGRKATEWRLTDKPTKSEAPTRDWQQKQHPRKTERGSKADHIATPTGPSKNRDNDLRSGPEPVSNHCGSNFDPFQNRI